MAIILEEEKIAMPEGWHYVDEIIRSGGITLEPTIDEAEATAERLKQNTARGFGIPSFDDDDPTEPEPLRKARANTRRIRQEVDGMFSSRPTDRIDSATPVIQPDIAPTESTRTSLVTEAEQPETGRPLFPTPQYPSAVMTPDQTREVTAPLERGIKRNLPLAAANALRFGGVFAPTEQKYRVSGAPVVGVGSPYGAFSPLNMPTEEDFTKVADAWRDRIMQIPVPEPDPEMMRAPESFGEWLQPKRIWTAFAENAPLTVALGVGYAVNPALGTALMMAVEGGGSKEAIDDYEKKTGKKLSEAKRRGIPIAVGAFNAALERTGIETILGKGPLGKHAKNLIVKGLVSAATEGTTEGIQEISSILGELGYNENAATDAAQRIIQSFYGGLVTGGIIGGVIPSDKGDGSTAEELAGGEGEPTDVLPPMTREEITGKQQLPPMPAPEQPETILPVVDEITPETPPETPETVEVTPEPPEPEIVQPEQAEQAERVKEPWEMTREVYIDQDNQYIKARQRLINAQEYMGGDYRWGEARRFAGARAENRIKKLDKAKKSQNLWYDRAEKRHKKTIEQALASGKPVPPEVLKDYPDLLGQAPKETQTEPKPKVQKGGKKKEVPPPKIYKDKTYLREAHVTPAMEAIRGIGNYGGEGEFFNNIVVGNQPFLTNPNAEEIDKLKVELQRTKGKDHKLYLKKRIDKLTEQGNKRDLRDMAVENYNAYVEQSNDPLLLKVDSWDELKDLAESDYSSILEGTSTSTEKAAERDKTGGYTFDEAAEMERQYNESLKESGHAEEDVRRIEADADRDADRDAEDAVKSELSDLAGEKEITDEELDAALDEWDAITGLSESPETPTEQPPESTPQRKIGADRTESLVDTKDARTGEEIKAGETVYYLPDTKETVKESTYQGMTELPEQEGLFAPAPKEKVEEPTAPKTEKKTPKDIMDVPYSAQEEAQQNIFAELEGQEDLFKAAKKPEKPTDLDTLAKTHGINPGQQSFVTSKIRALGTVEAVKEKYGFDSSIDTFAREAAGVMLGAETPSKPSKSETTKETPQPEKVAPESKTPADFANYNEYRDHIDERAKEYGGKNEFYTSDEYKSLYPIGKKLFEKNTVELRNDAKKALDESGVKYGERVFYGVPSLLTGTVDVFKGELVERSGAPYVKLDEKTTTGKRHVLWNKGWKKESPVKAKEGEAAPIKDIEELRPLAKELWETTYPTKKKPHLEKYEAEVGVMRVAKHFGIDSTRLDVAEKIKQKLADYGITRKDALTELQERFPEYKDEKAAPESKQAKPAIAPELPLDESIGRGWEDRFRVSSNFATDIRDGDYLPASLLKPNERGALNASHHYTDSKGRHRKLNFYESLVDVPEEKRLAYLETFRKAPEPKFYKKGRYNWYVEVDEKTGDEKLVGRFKSGNTAIAKTISGKYRAGKDLNIDDFISKRDDVIRKAGEPAPAPESKAKEPWEMTRGEFEQSYKGKSFDERFAPTDEVVKERVGSDKPQDTINHYIEKYPELKGLEFNIDTELEKLNPQSRQASIYINKGMDFDTGEIDWNKVKITGASGVAPESIRHEIEHALDILHTAPSERRNIKPNTFKRFRHNKFQYDYRHRQAVKQALASGKPVPDEVLKDYPELVKGEKGGGGSSSGQALVDKHWEIENELEPKTGEKVNKTQIMRAMEKAFNIPIKGKATHKWRAAVGAYYPQDQIVRMKKWGEIAVAAHEVAHHLDDQVKKSLENIRWKTQINPEGSRKILITELSNLDYNQQQRRTSEGFAEFMRYYLTTDKAKSKAPHFYEAFTERFLPDHPDIKEKLDSIKSLIDTWQQQGAENRILAQIDFKGEHTKVQGVKAKVRKAYNWLQRHFNDEFYDVQRIEREIEKATGKKLRPSESPSALMEYGKSKAGVIARTFVMDKTIDESGNVTGKGLFEILDPISPDDMPRFIAYASAKRALLLESRGKESGFDIEDAQYITDKYGSEEWDNVIDDITEWSNHMLDWVVRAGGLGRKEAAIMRELNPIYLPFKRAFVDELGVHRGAGRTFANRGQAVKRLKGSGRPIVNPLESLIAQSSEMILKAQKIRIASTLAEIAKREGIGGFITKVPPPTQVQKVSLTNIKDFEGLLRDPGLLEEGEMTDLDLDKMATVFFQGWQYTGKDNIVSIWRDGKREFYELHPDLYRALNGMDALTAKGTLTIIASKFSRMLRLGATGLKVSFGLVTNPFRDTFFAAITSKNKHSIPFVNTARGVALEARAKEGDLAWRFKKTGGALSGMIGYDRAATMRTYDDLLFDKLDAKGKSLYVAEHPIQALGKLVDYTREAISFTELAPRIDELTKSYKRLQKEHSDWTEEDCYIAAFNEAQDVTVNFTKSGHTAKRINEVAAFFNVSIRGPEKTYRTMKEHPVSTIARGTAYLTLTALLSYWRNKDKDWFKNLPPAYKYMNIFIEFKDGAVMRLPLPFEFGIMFASLPMAALDTIIQKDPEYAKGFMELLIRQIPNPTPSIMKPVFDPVEWTGVAFNKNYLGIPIESGGMKYLPVTERKRHYTTKLASVMSKGFNALGIELSPIQIDYLLDSYTGGFRRQIPGKTINEPADIPVLGDIMLRMPDNPRRQMNNYFADWERLGQKNKMNTLTAEERRQYGRMKIAYRYLNHGFKRLKKLTAEDKKDMESIKETYRLMSDKLSKVGYN